MELTLSRRGDYVVRAALSLGRAAESDGYRKIREVADEMDLPVLYTPQILGLLLKAGLAESKAGQTGGYRLLKPPAEISLLEVIEAGEGPLWPRRCTLIGGPCHWEDMCALHPALEVAYKSLSETLAGITLASVLETDRQLENGGPFRISKPHSESMPRLPRRVRGKPASAKSQAD
jgi:Rrf2 family protein